MIQDLTISREEITFGFDSVVVRKFTNGVEGGVMLDVTNYQLPNVLAGQVVISDGRVIRPMPVEGDCYGDLPEGFKYYGVVYRSSRVNIGVSIMTRGSINKYRVPYNFELIRDDFQEQCPMVILASDCEQMDEWARLEAVDGRIFTADNREIVFRTGVEGRANGV